MRALRSLAHTLTLFACAAASAGAQEQPQDGRVSDVVGAILNPTWNAFISGGGGTTGRFLLQRTGGVFAGERTLRRSDAFTVGVGGGMDFFLRSGVRASYSFSAADMKFRTDNGDGSEDLDFEDSSSLQNHILSAEVIRYMLPSRAPITPYGSAGLVGNWWVLDESSPFVVASGGSTQFRLGATASFGVQFQFAGYSAARLEVASTSIRSPFTGKDSFVAPGGVTVDEPTRVTQTDFKMAAVLYFGRAVDPKLPGPVAAK